jgi:hypothetical protein
MKKSERTNETSSFASAAVNVEQAKFVAHDAER